MKYILDQIQVVFFSPGVVVSDRLALAGNLINAGNGIFDGDPTIIPLPEEAPLELPRIILKSKDNRSLLKVAQSRVDLHLSGPNLEYTGGRSPKPPLEVISNVFDVVEQTARAKINREALVTTWSIELNNPSAEYMASNYLRPGFLTENPASAEIHILHKLQLANDVASNRWLRIYSAHYAKDLNKSNYLLVQVDINSVVEQEYTFDSASTLLFINDASEETGKTLLEYIG